MVMRVFAPQFLVVRAFIGYALAVHFRGRVRFGILAAGFRSLHRHGALQRPDVSVLCGAESVDPAGRDDNRWLSTHIINESATQNREGKRVGWINRVVSSVYQCTLPASG